jgi:hypothetical protein
LQDPGQKAASKQATDSSSTLPAAAPQQQTANAASSSSSSSSTSAADGDAVDAACPSGSQLNELAPGETTAAGSDSIKDSQQLHTIREQSTSLGWLQQQQQLGSTKGQPLTNDSGMTQHSQRPSSPRHRPNMSELSESDLALLESPFAINLSGQFSEDLAGAGLIPESEVMLDVQVAEKVKSAAAAAAAAEHTGKPDWKRTQSMPASSAATAAAGAAEGVNIEQQQPQQQQQQLRQRASCSVLQRRLTTRASTVPGYKMKPLQVRWQWVQLQLEVCGASDARRTGLVLQVQDMLPLLICWS